MLVHLMEPQRCSVQAYGYLLLTRLSVGGSGNPLLRDDNLRRPAARWSAHAAKPVAGIPLCAPDSRQLCTMERLWHHRGPAVGSSCVKLAMQPACPALPRQDSVAPIINDASSCVSSSTNSRLPGLHRTTCSCRRAARAPGQREVSHAARPHTGCWCCLLHQECRCSALCLDNHRRGAGKGAVELCKQAARPAAG